MNLFPSSNQNQIIKCFYFTASLWQNAVVKICFLLGLDL